MGVTEEDMDNLRIVSLFDVDLERAFNMPVGADQHLDAGLFFGAALRTTAVVGCWVVEYTSTQTTLFGLFVHFGMGAGLKSHVVLSLVLFLPHVFDLQTWMPQHELCCDMLAGVCHVHV